MNDLHAIRLKLFFVDQREIELFDITVLDGHELFIPNFLSLKFSLFEKSTLAAASFSDIIGSFYVVIIAQRPSNFQY